MADIRVPRETVNDDAVRVVRWLASDGDVVRAAAAVVEIETSKSVLEVEAPEAGRLSCLSRILLLLRVHVLPVRLLVPPRVPEVWIHEEVTLVHMAGHALA